VPHIHDQYDFTVSVFIVFEDKILLVNHPRYGKWLPIGGHIELDEDPEEALFREVKEETSLEVEILSTKPNLNEKDVKFIFTPNYVDVHLANPPHKHIGLIYFAKSKNDQHIQSEEHTDIQWLTIDELEEPKYGLNESIKFYAREAIKKANHS